MLFKLRNISEYESESWIKHFRWRGPKTDGTCDAVRKQEHFDHIKCVFDSFCWKCPTDGQLLDESSGFVDSREFLQLLTVSICNASSYLWHWQYQCFADLRAVCCNKIDLTAPTTKCIYVTAMGLAGDVAFLNLLLFMHQIINQTGTLNNNGTLSSCHAPTWGISKYRHSQKTKKKHYHHIIMFKHFLSQLQHL